MPIVSIDTTGARSDGQRTAQSKAQACGWPFTSTEVVYGVTGTGVTELPEYGVSP